MNKIGKIIIALFVALIILFACWLLFVHIRGKGLNIPTSKPTTETMSVMTKLEGAQANKYILDEDKQNTIYTAQHVQRPIEYCYMDSVVDDTTVHSAYQNELYAVKLGNKWLYKYGVTGKEIDPDVRTKSYLWAEYASHNIKSKIEALSRLDRSAEIASVHFTHVYRIDNSRKYNGIQIGAWLHIMEMSGHYALFKYLQTFHPNSTIMTISDNKFKLTNTNKVDIIKQHNPDGVYDKINTLLTEGLHVSATRVDGLIRKFLKIPSNELKQWKHIINTPDAEDESKILALAAMIKVANKFASDDNNRGIDYDKLKFETKSIQTSEFFCPLDPHTEEYIEHNDPYYALSRTRELASIHRYIISYQKYVVNACNEFLNEKINNIQKDIDEIEPKYNALNKYITKRIAKGKTYRQDAVEARDTYANQLKKLKGKQSRRESMRCKIVDTLIYRNKIDDNVIQMKTMETFPDKLYKGFTYVDEFWKSMLKHKKITIHGSAKDGTYNGAHEVLLQQPNLHDIPLIKQ